MKGDFKKIWEIVRYKPRVFRRLKLLTSRDRIVSHLEKKIKKHEEFNELVNSLSDKDKEEVSSYISQVNNTFDKSVKKYKEMFNIK